MTEKASDTSGCVVKVPIGICALGGYHGPRLTMDRLAAIAASRRMNNFACIDHGTGAVELGLALRSTALLMFGNAPGGTPLMQSAQTIGFDLPLKILIWVDAAGKKWLACNDARWLADRHGIAAEQAPMLVTFDEMLASLAREAAGESEGAS